MPTSSKKSLRESTRVSFEKQRAKVHAYKNRRPHRSFRMTRRRDYARSLKLPGYISFTNSVNRTLWQYRKVFVWLGILYAVLTIVLVGIGSQDTYLNLTDALYVVSTDVLDGDIGQLGQAVAILATIGAGGLTGTLTEGQQIYAVILTLLVWLTTIWLLRNLTAGHKVNMRDGLYSAGAPIIPTFIVAFALLVQLIPIGLVFVAYSAASASGLLAGGVEAMVFWVAAVMMGVLSLYWITSTFLALIIITLPGMYPMRALRVAGDMVVGRRIRILLRILWMIAVIAVTWIIVLIPVILLDGWLKGVWPQIEWIPIVPVVILLLGTLAVMWSSSYVYLLYRKVVDDDAQPA